MLRPVLALSFVLALASPAAAAKFVFSGNATGAQEVPGVVSSGKGLIVATYDDNANTLRIQTSFSGLTGNTTMAHVHCCAPAGANAGVATTVPSLAGFPLGVKFGSSDTVLDLTLASSFNPTFVTNNGGLLSARIALITGLNDSRTYFNIHTAFSPRGEIRAQLAPVPEPATWAMMIAGFGAAGAALRSRRRRAAVA